jgi:LIM domain
MSKTQLSDYLSSIRGGRSGQPRPLPKELKVEDSDDRGSTPLVRALREKYGSGNTTAGYVDVGISKDKENVVKRPLPPVPGPKSENSTGWKVGPSPSKGRTESEVKPDVKRREEIPYPKVRDNAPKAGGGFWDTGIVRPLPYLPKEDDQRTPRDELSSSFDQLSFEESKRDPLPAVPKISIPTINTPSVDIPSSRSPPQPSEDSDKPIKSRPTVQHRSKSSSVLLCTACSKPISGRIVSAIGSRFHPDCFRCQTCGTELVSHLSSFLRLRNTLHSMKMTVMCIVIWIITSYFLHGVNIVTLLSKTKLFRLLAINTIQVPISTKMAYSRSFFLCRMW